MKYTFTVVALISMLLIQDHVSAQSFLWAKGGTASSMMHGHSIAIDNDQNVVISGTFFNQAAFGSAVINGNGLQDAFLTKYDSTGNVLWAISMGGNEQDWGRSVAVDNANNILIAGHFKSDAIYFTNQDSITASFPGATNSFIAKYDPNGNFLWARGGGGLAANTTEATAVTTDASGNVIISGSYNSSAQFSSVTISGGAINLFYVKYAPNGSIIWAISGVASSLCKANALATDVNGNIYTTGKASSDLIFGGQTFPKGSGDDAFVAKLNAAGDIQWLNFEGNNIVISTTGNDLDSGNGIAVNSGGDVYITGSLFDTVLPPFNTRQKIMIAKYNNAGIKAWLKEFGSSDVTVANGISLDMNENLVIIGNHKEEINFGAGIVSASNDVEIFIASFDQNGNNLWVKSVKGNSNDYGAAVTISPLTNKIATTGYFRSTINFDNINVTNAGVPTTFVAYQNSLPVGIINPLISSKIEICPNPASKFISINAEGLMSFDIRLFNINGELIYSRKNLSGNTIVPIDHLSKGIYFISITNEEGNDVQKVVIQ